MPEKEILAATPLIAFFLISAWVVMKGMPRWERVKIAEIEVHKGELKIREEEIKLRHEEAVVIGGLTEIFKVQTDTIEELKIFLRASTRKHELIESRMTQVEEHLLIAKTK